MSKPLFLSSRIISLSPLDDARYAPAAPRADGSFLNNTCTNGSGLLVSKSTILTDTPSNIAAIWRAMSDTRPKRILAINCNAPTRLFSRINDTTAGCNGADIAAASFLSRKSTSGEALSIYFPIRSRTCACRSGGNLSYAAFTLLGTFFGNSPLASAVFVSSVDGGEVSASPA